MFGVHSNSIGLAVIVQRKPFVTRDFTVCTLLHKKTSRTKRNTKTLASKDSNDPEEIVDINAFMTRARNSFENTLERHKKKLNEFRQGVANPHIFDRLELTNGSRLIELSSVSPKGKNALLVTVYDPKNTKHIISAIMAAGLNLNPERVPGNNQQLRVALPPMTTETRMKMCKDLKKIFEEYKNSSSKYSLGYARSEILRELKKLTKKDDSVRRVIQDIEKIHKDYVNKMQQQLIQAEKNVMNN